jgi:Acyl-CoA thioesterase C-terminal domain/Acyl-CoA thioesterase N-terminal domain
VADALYEADGDVLVPSPLTAGPWSPDAQHGGPVAALLARTIESAPAAAPMQLVRLTVEFLRPVPLRPLTVSAAVIRPGKKVQVVDATVSVDGAEVVRGRALMIRVEGVDVPDQDPQPPSPPLPADLARTEIGTSRTAFANAVDLRFVKGGFEELGPVTMWSRLLLPVVAGEEPSAIQRVAAAADFGNGVSHILDFDSHVFVNPDLTVALSRVPVGDWIGFDVVSRLSGDGFGQAESLVFDADGPVGRAVQSILVERR